MIAITRPFRAVGRAARWCWRRATPEAVRKVRDVALIFLAVAVVAGVVSIIGLVRQSADRGRQNRTTLVRLDRAVSGIEDVQRRIKAQTSPEAQARQQRTVNAIIAVVDCRQQANNQRIIDVLVERGVLSDGDVRAITAECDRQRRQDGG
ncbi:MAG: hypothetical protein JWM89_1791 [Acidimicrobiales bacterium]|nr:hypothetical protein [Acidimicrobiales bacterium]